MSFFTFNQQVSLARSLFTKTSPAYVQFYITSRCNLACEQCNIIYADADSNEMNIHQIRKMARNFSEIGVSMVLLIGGEPFIRKDIHEIIRAFTSNGIHVRMQTNGIATESRLRECVKAGGHDISISLDSLNGSVQDSINGGFNNSWERAIKAVASINKVFPENGTGFFGTVLMPKNLEHIKDVLEFATKIGWGVSLVPAHVSSVEKPMGFRTFDDDGVCTFDPSQYPRVKQVLEELKVMRDSGYNLYDSDVYLDDIYRFIAKEPLQWRQRNDNVCDSPNLYFAVEPNGNIKPCCDFKLQKDFKVFDDKFPEVFQSGVIHQEVYQFTRSCNGCMYGSYPEISITARYLKPFLHRLKFFNKDAVNTLQKISYEDMVEIAKEIFQKNEIERSKKVSMK